MYRAKALCGSVLALCVLYKTLCGYCTSTSSQVRVTDFQSKIQGIYTNKLLVYSFTVAKSLSSGKATFW